MTMYHAEDSSSRSRAGESLFFSLAVVAAIVFFFLSVVLSTLLMAVFTRPSTAFTAVGVDVSSGFPQLILFLFDHLIWVLSLAVTFSVFTSMGISLLKQVGFEKVKSFGPLALAFLMAVGMGWQFLNVTTTIPTPYEIVLAVMDKTSLWGINQSSLNELPVADAVLGILLFAYFCYRIISKEDDVTRQKSLTTLFAFPIVVSICFIIVYFTLAVAVFMHLLSTILDIWHWLDITIGQIWNFLHIVLTVVSVIT